MAKKKDLVLINPSGTVVTLVHDPERVDPARNVLYIAAEPDFRAAGYREVEEGEPLPPQHHETAGQEAPSSFAERAVPSGINIE